RGITVELQWRLEGLPALTFEELWRARGTLDVACQPLPTLPGDVNALYLFAHGARHGWASLFWLLDIALLLPAVGPGLWAAAGRLRLTRPLLQGVALAGQLLGVAPPDDLREPLARADANGPLLAEARRRISQPEVRPIGLGPVFRDTLYAFRLQETWRGRASLVQPRLLSPQNWKLWPLPDRWFWLYYPASPVLWAWRRLRE
ncbi:MAG: nucleotidyltransferase family protein, partial [Limisphaerales bacterium]